MLNPLFDINRLRVAIEAGVLIVTSNLRLARKIREAWNQHCLKRGDTSWPAPDILPLSTWLDNCWLQLVDGAWPPAMQGVPSQPLQEQWLWEKILAADEITATNPSGFAVLAQSGWQRVREWQVPTTELAGSHHPGARALLRWGHAWEGEMGDHGLVDSAQRAMLIRDAFTRGELPRQPCIHLVGFQSLSPLHEDILNRAAQQLHSLPPPPPRQQPRAVSTADLTQEITAAARWALACAQHDPTARIGIVVPDLAALRVSVERVFLHHFDPAWCWPNQSYRPPPFNISAATPLADQPLVASALDLLALNHQRLPVDQLTRIINCPLWGNDTQESALREAGLRALLDSGLAEIPTHFLRRLFSELESPVEGSMKPMTPGLRLARMADSLRHKPARCSFAQWRQRFEHQLDILGWPGERPLNSLEYQAREHWTETQDKLASLDKVASSVPAAVALARLRQLTADTPFQADTPDAQVQILGTLEAAGLQFDHLWVLQMDDRHWPATTSPHPLLPVDLQRRLHMPHASPARELGLGRDLFNLFTASGREVVFSHARQDGDIHLQPSALLGKLDIIPLPVEDSCHIWTSRIAASTAPEVVEDSTGPLLDLSGTTDPDPLPRAGSLLADQANCPFNAFARYRLGAVPLPQPMAGLSPMARGNLVHYSLEAFWRELADQRALAQLSEDHRHQRLSAAVDTAFARFLRLSPLSAELSERYLALEKARTVSLISRWLLWELERQPFAIAGLELKKRFTLDGLGIHLRIDRVDRQNHGLVITDYKTGNASLGGLTGDRLLSPQLALYAVAMGMPLAGLGYGLISSTGVGFAGLTRESDTLPGAQSLAEKGLPETWQGTLEKWHNQLIEIKNEIVAGLAPVIFYSREATHYGGDLEPLNRWQGRERLARLKATLGETRP